MHVNPLRGFEPIRIKENNIPEQKPDVENEPEATVQTPEETEITMGIDDYISSIESEQEEQNPLHQYIMRDSDDRLIIPDEIAEKFKELGDDINPYIFSMIMITSTDYETVLTALNEVLAEQIHNNTLSAKIEEKRDEIENTVRDSILELFKNYVNGEIDEFSTINHMLELLFNGDWDSFYNSYFAQFDLTDDEKQTLYKLKQDIESLQNEIFRHYRDDIFEQIKGEEYTQSDNDKFMYYLKYAKLIQNEGGIEYCTKLSDLGIDGNDVAALNELLLSGKLSVSTAEIDRDGNVTETRVQDAVLSPEYVSEKLQKEYQEKLDEVDKKLNEILENLDIVTKWDLENVQELLGALEDALYEIYQSGLDALSNSNLPNEFCGIKMYADGYESVMAKISAISAKAEMMYDVSCNDEIDKDKDYFGYSTARYQHIETQLSELMTNMKINSLDDYNQIQKKLSGFYEEIYLIYTLSMNGLSDANAFFEGIMQKETAKYEETLLKIENVEDHANRLRRRMLYRNNPLLGSLLKPKK